MNAPTTTTEPPVIRRRPRLPADQSRRRSFHCPDDVWERALEAANENGVSLASVLVEAADRYARKNGH
jgi:hypothetical protein